MSMKINDWRRLWGSPYLNLFAVDYRDRHEHHKTWTLASRQADGPKCLTGKIKMADAVVIVPYHRRRNQLVVIREFRVVLGGFQYGFPAGLIDPGETVQQAVERELVEETGLTVTRHLRQSPAVFASSGLTDEAVVMAYVDCEGEPSNAGNSGSEVIETHFLSPADADRLCRDDGILMDVKTWLVLSGFAGALFV